MPRAPNATRVVATVGPRAGVTVEQLALAPASDLILDVVRSEEHDRRRLRVHAYDGEAMLDRRLSAGTAIKVAWAADGKSMLVALTDEDTARWRVCKLALEHDILSVEGEGAIHDAALLDDGGVLTVGTDLTGARWLRSFDACGDDTVLEPLPGGPASMLACAPSGCIAVLEPSAGRNDSGRVDLYAPGNAAPETVSNGRHDRIAFSGDGRHLLLEPDIALLLATRSYCRVRGAGPLVADGRCVVSPGRDRQSVDALRSEPDLTLPWTTFSVGAIVDRRPFDFRRGYKPLPGNVLDAVAVVERYPCADVAFATGKRGIEVRRLADPDRLDITSEHSGRRRHGVTVAMRQPDPALIPTLAWILKVATTPDSDGAAAALARFAEPGVTKLLFALGGGLDAARSGGIVAALRDAPAAAVDAAVELALTASGEARIGALRLASVVAELDVGDALRPALGDTDPLVRTIAAEALGVRGDVTATLDLLAATTDPDAGVADAATHAMRALVERAGGPVGPLPTEDDPARDAFVRSVLETGVWVADAPTDTAAGGFAALSALLHTHAPSSAALDGVLERHGSASGRRADVRVLRVMVAAHAEGDDALRVLERSLPADGAPDDGPELTWRTLFRMAVLAESGDLEIAERHYARAMATIDRLWLALLGRPDDARFFRPKAELYDHAMLCALRLGHSARAVEILEKAKTRYLGDLIARFHEPWKPVLTRTQRAFWRSTGFDRHAAARGTGADTRAPATEIVGVGSADTPAAAATLPGAYADLRDAIDLGARVDGQGMLDEFWRWAGTLQRSQVSIAPGTPVGDALRAVRENLARVRDATGGGVRRPDPHEARSLMDEYVEATERLRRPGDVRGTDTLWEGRLWLETHLQEPERDGGLMLDAVAEAVDFLIGGPVGAVWRPASATAGSGLLLPHFVGGSRGDATSPSGYSLEQEDDLTYARQIARGQTARFRRTLAVTRADRSVAVLQFAVTGEGTIVFATTAREAREGALEGCQDWDGPRTYTNRGLTAHELTRRLTEANKGWQHAYDYRGTDEATWRTSTSTLLQWLHGQLFAPIEPWLRANGVRRLLVIPHRGLHQVPFGAWFEQRRGRRRYVIDDYHVRYAPSLTIEEICARRSAHRTETVQRVIAVLDPTADLALAKTDLAPLGRPVQTVRPATAARWGEAAPTADVCHYGGHGEYSLGAPLKSFLRLEDERLELGALFGGGFRLPRAQLMTLAGCETAMTDPSDWADEHLGLASGFVFAGAPAVLSTLWVVEEVSSAMLIRRYYSAIAAGDSPDAALARAQRWLRDDVGRSDVHKFLREAEVELARDEGLDDAARDRLAKHRSDHGRALARPFERPFRDPVFWAPFIVSGAQRALTFAQTS